MLVLKTYASNYYMVYVLDISVRCYYCKWLYCLFL